MSNSFENAIVHNFKDMSISELELLLQLFANDTISMDENTLMEITDALAEKNQVAGNFPKTPAESFEDFKQRSLTNTPAVRSCRTIRSVARKQRAWYPAVRVIVILAVIFLFGGIAPAVCGVDNLFTIIGEWTDSYFYFHNDPVDYSKKEYTLQDVHLATELFCKEEQLAPHWIPDGFSVETIEVLDHKDKVSIAVCFRNQDKYIYYRSSAKYAEDTSQYEKDLASANLYVVGDSIFYIMTNYEKLYCSWAVNNTECQIWGDLTEKELYAMIDSIFKEV